MSIAPLFGVPGDYNLELLNKIHGSKISWVGTCNELGAAYAADAYARIKGISALLTTYGVGELSAINGIAGAYAEHVPVVKIVVMPTYCAQQEDIALHHSLGNKDYMSFFKMYQSVTVSQLLINHSTKNISEKLNAILLECWQKKRPVYIGISGEMIEQEIKKPNNSIKLSFPASEKKELEKILQVISPLIQKAKSPVFLIDMNALRYSMQNLIAQFIESTGIPFVTTAMAKGALNEYHSNFLGLYSGLYEGNTASKIIQESDCVIAFGLIIKTELNINKDIDNKAFLNIKANSMSFQGSNIGNVYFADLIPNLIDTLKNNGYFYNHNGSYVDNTDSTISNSIASNEDNNTITQDTFWQIIQGFLKPGEIIISDVGTSLFGVLSMRFPQNTIFISQLLWASIGYSLGALLGSQLAVANKKRAILFIGDGAFHMIEQEIATILKLKLNPVIFLINNSFYTIEEAVCESMGDYNQITNRQYSYIKDYFDNQFMNFFSVSNKNELVEVLDAIDSNKDKLNFVEVNFLKDDIPKLLNKLITKKEKRNVV